MVKKEKKKKEKILHSSKDLQILTRPTMENSHDLYMRNRPDLAFTTYG